MDGKDKERDGKTSSHAQEAGEGDADLWSYATRDVSRMKKSRAEEAFYAQKGGAPEEDDRPKKKAPPPRDVHNHPIRIRHEKQNVQRGNDVDARTMQRLRRGQIPIEGRLDLHGMNQEEAYSALSRFVMQSYHMGRRCVLVITGKGGRQFAGESMLDRKVGVLLQKTPEWLREPHMAEMVLKVQASRPEHGGDGAVYVLLRRQRG